MGALFRVVYRQNSIAHRKRQAMLAACGIMVRQGSRRKKELHLEPLAQLLAPLRIELGQKGTLVELDRAAAELGSTITFLAKRFGLANQALKFGYVVRAVIAIFET